MSLDSIVSVAISASSKTPTRPGFGTPLICASAVPAGWGSAKVKTFGSLSEILDEGFLVTDPVYRLATKLKSASPSVKLMKIGKRSLPPTKAVKLTVTIATEGYVYDFTVGTTEVSYTVLAAATTSTVATALAALINADAAVNASAASAVITCVAAAGVLFDVIGWYDHDLTLLDDTPDPGIATDLAAFLVADKDWYGVLGDNFGLDENLAAAAWVEANEKLFIAETSDTACADAGSTTDLAYLVKSLAYARTAVIANNTSLLEFSAAAWLGNAFPQTIGSFTWKFKTLPGVSPSTWKEGEKTALFAKRANTYTEIGGLNITENGITGSGEWLDVTQGLDWLRSEIKVRVFAMLANAPKIPYTNPGANMVISVLEGALADGVKAGLLAADPEPFATAPDVADVDSTIRATRHLPDIEFEGRLAGAIHTLAISGTLSV